MNVLQPELLNRLTFGDIDSQIKCLDEIMASIKLDNKLPDLLRDTLISCLKTSAYPEFIAERLVPIAGRLVTDLQLLLSSDASADARFCAALLLLHANVCSGVPLLLQAIEARNQSWYLLAAAKLAEANERSAIPLIMRVIQALATTLDGLTNQGIDEIVSLLGTLKRFDTSIPPELFEKLASDNVPWQIRYELGLPVDIKKTFGTTKKSMSPKVTNQRKA